ncbi:unnamed protein product [Hymenolepis diminuta]|uniref:Ovule protein n=1 Tax=Hymenolepis diminuta TaxID=6216 RepID=A0A0R3SUH8_HYMDI|nr:unnamed protein product [Hymenolepis diminuta]
MNYSSSEHEKKSNGTLSHHRLISPSAHYMTGSNTILSNSPIAVYDSTRNFPEFIRYYLPIGPYILGELRFDFLCPPAIYDRSHNWEQVKCEEKTDSVLYFGRTPKIGHRLTQ